MPFRTFTEQAAVGNITLAGTGNRRRQDSTFVIQAQLDAVGVQIAYSHRQTVFTLKRLGRTAVARLTTIIIVVTSMVMTVLVARSIIIFIIMGCTSTLVKNSRYGQYSFKFHINTPEKCGTE